MFDWIASHPDLGRVDICINNAGLSSAESLRDGSMESWRKMLDVNVLALCLCTQLAVNLMTKHGVADGQIIMISSMSGIGQSEHSKPCHMKILTNQNTAFHVT